jgi:hypothetical protein
MEYAFQIDIQQIKGNVVVEKASEKWSLARPRPYFTA